MGTNSTGDLLPVEGLSTVDIIIALVVFVILFGVGTSCDPVLMRNVVTHRVAVLGATTGVCVQYLLMPVLSYIITLIFQMEPATALGVIVCGIVPGGSTSAVFTMASLGVVELSVFMTIVSTLLGFGMIPLWLFVFGEKALGFDGQIDFVNLVIGLALLIVPLIIGAVVRHFFPNSIDIIEKVTAVVTVLFVIAALIVVAIEYKDALRDSDWKPWVASIFYFFIASNVGYVIARFVFKFSPATARTIWCEVGIQNTTLSYGLISLTIRNSQAARNAAIVFPYAYTLFMFFEAGCFIPLWRWQKRANDEEGIEDVEDDFNKLKLEMEQEHEQEHVQLDEAEDRQKIEGEEGKEEKTEEEKAFEKIKELEEEERKKKTEPTYEERNDSTVTVEVDQ